MALVTNYARSIITEIISGLQRSLKKEISLKRRLSRTEIFSKRRKIYSIWAKDLSYVMLKMKKIPLIQEQ